MTTKEQMTEDTLRKQIDILLPKANAFEYIEKYIKSKDNPALNVYDNVSLEALNDGCYSSGIILKYFIEKIVEYWQDAEEEVKELEEKIKELRT